MVTKKRTDTSRVRKQTEQEKRKAALLKLLAMLGSMFQRRHFYEVQARALTHTTLRTAGRCI